MTEPTEPTKTGYSFGGWYEDNITFLNAYIFGTMPAENVTLYAQWTVNKYKITFESNGGSDVADITADYGAAVAEPTEPSKTGYSFGGWYTDNNTFQKVYTFGTMPAENVTLYAKWEKKLESLEITTKPSITNYIIGDTFNANGLKVQKITAMAALKWHRRMNMN